MLIPSIPEQYSIAFAGIGFQLITPQPVAISKRFEQFIREPAADDFEIRFECVPELPAVPEMSVYRCLEYEVFRGYDGTVFIRFTEHNGKVYAVSKQTATGTLIRYLEWGGRYVSELQNCFFHSGWEHLLLTRGRLLLHASLIDTRFGGILFSGPSGIGKSTQAKLWERFEGARQLNGDRPVVWQEDGSWLASGSPYAGSSGIHLNEQCTVKAAVMLEQKPECSIRRLGEGEAFRRLFPQMAVNTWRTEDVASVFDKTALLAKELPVYELGCTPDERAVETLRNVLEE